MIFRQLFDLESSTYTYLLADEASREAVLIDPVREQLERDLKLLGELNLKLRYAMETHVHADHVTSGGMLRERTGCQTVVSVEGGAACADILTRGGQSFQVGNLEIKVLATPGHTNGCVSYLVGNKVFTGDALLIRGTGRTDFQQGDSGRLYDSITTQLFTLPEDTEVYPGHDYRGLTSSSIAEEKTLNPRVGGKTKAEYIEIMANLKLAMPKKIQEAVPANLLCGLGKKEPPILDQLLDASIPRAGHRDLTVEGFKRFLGRVKVVDVREGLEFNGDLGHIAGAENAPLSSGLSPMQPWDRQTPLVVVCRSGNRSALAARAMADMGFRHVFNLAGGMLEWNQAGYPVDRK